MKKILGLSLVLTILTIAACKSIEPTVTISRDTMLDKVKGAWAGKMIGVMYGRPMEFQCCDTIYTPQIDWKPDYIAAALNEDDIYGQLNFMATMDLYGQDVAIDSLAHRFAHAQFPLCHANLQARKNYLDGVPANQLSTHANNFHCEDIDFQIECDFIGFINPCMPQSADSLCDKIGSIMAAGDGLYAGIFMSTLHSLAFAESDIPTLVDQALLSIPAESAYARLISDVVAAYNNDPTDWTKAWHMLDEKWADDDICTPYLPFNIDAKLNGGYVIMGLLYGQGDWMKTMEITVRCGQDTDCNTANAGALLGIISGYNAIPDELKSGIPAIADSNFLFTDFSYNRAVDTTMRFIAENIVRNGGEVTETEYIINRQTPTPAEMVSGYENLRLSYMITAAQRDKWQLTGHWTDFSYGDGDDDPYIVATAPGDVASVEFTGTGIAILGSWNTDAGRAQVAIDGKPVGVFDSYYVTEAGKYQGNRAFLFFKFDLPEGDHTLSITNLPEANPASSANKIYIERLLIYK